LGLVFLLVSLFIPWSYACLEAGNGELDFTYIPYKDLQKQRIRLNLPVLLPLYAQTGFCIGFKPTERFYLFTVVWMHFAFLFASIVLGVLSFVKESRKLFIALIITQVIAIFLFIGYNVYLLMKVDKVAELYKEEMTLIALPREGLILYMISPLFLRMRTFKLKYFVKREKEKK